MIHFEKMVARFSAIIFFVILMIGLSACVDTDVESGKYELKIKEFVNQAVDDYEDQQKERMLSPSDLANTKRSYKKTK